MIDIENANLLKYIFENSIQSGNIENIRIIGFSMEPSLNQNDKISVQKCNSYSLGDIIVFNYQNEGILAHRIVYIDKKNVFCKGDNAFRIECISKSQIIGKAIKVNNLKIEKCKKELVYLSKMVGDIFHELNNNKTLTLQTGIYRYYQQYIRNITDHELLYFLNKNVIFVSNNTIIINHSDIDGEKIILSKLAKEIISISKTPKRFEDILMELRNLSNIEDTRLVESLKKEISICITKHILMVK